MTRSDLDGLQKILGPFSGHLALMETENAWKKHNKYEKSWCPKKCGLAPLSLNFSIQMVQKRSWYYVNIF